MQAKINSCYASEIQVVCWWVEMQEDSNPYQAVIIQKDICSKAISEPLFSD